jgi:hydrogenase maturation protease
LNPRKTVCVSKEGSPPRMRRGGAVVQRRGSAGNRGQRWLAQDVPPVVAGYHRWLPPPVAPLPPLLKQEGSLLPSFSAGVASFEMLVGRKETPAVNQWEWDLLENKIPADSVEIEGVQVRIGGRVRLRPRAGGDVFDLALANKVALVESIEQDYEGKLHLGVVVEDDPGRDIGLMRQPGHRFFFTPEEVQPLPQDEQVLTVAGKKILIAGIGNIFQADDGFGVAVAAKLAAHAFPPGVRAADFGIRGFDLAYALLDGYETTILVDAYPGQGEPGTLFVIEPDLKTLHEGSTSPGFVEPHAMNPLNVLRMALSMGELKRVLLLGCVPATLGPEEGHMGLSAPVEAAVDEAVKLVDSLVERILAGELGHQEE